MTEPAKVDSLDKEVNFCKKSGGIGGGGRGKFLPKIYLFIMLKYVNQIDQTELYGLD